MDGNNVFNVILQGLFSLVLGACGTWTAAYAVYWLNKEQDSEQAGSQSEDVQRKTSAAAGGSKPKDSSEAHGPVKPGSILSVSPLLMTFVLGAVAFSIFRSQNVNFVTVLPTPVATVLPTVAQAFTPPPPTPTSPSPLSMDLPSQTDVFSPGCSLLNYARRYVQFYQGQAGISAALVGDGRNNQGLRLDFSNVTFEQASYAGWEVWLGADDQNGIDLSPYRSLVFYVRGREGGEEPNVWLMMPVLVDYDRYYTAVREEAPVTTSWQRVEISLTAFTLGQGAHEEVDLRDIQRIQIVFEWYPTPRSGTIFIDDLCVE